MMKSFEIIWHFSCEECKGWWSIAASDKWKPKKLFCPHCGVNTDFSDKGAKDD
jgi:ribosomal protein L33